MSGAPKIALAGKLRLLSMAETIKRTKAKKEILAREDPFIK
jgi:hypothetical protein